MTEKEISRFLGLVDTLVSRGIGPAQAARAAAFAWAGYATSLKRGERKEIVKTCETIAESNGRETLLRQNKK